MYLVISMLFVTAICQGLSSFTGQQVPRSMLPTEVLAIFLTISDQQSIKYISLNIFFLSSYSTISFFELPKA